MDGRQFDDLSRRISVGASRRGVLLSLTGAMLAAGVAIVPGGQEISAKRRKRKRRKKNTPPPCVPNCVGKVCGADGCVGSCGECTGGRVCNAGRCECLAGQDVCGGACLAPCVAPTVRNPITCTCCVPAGTACEGVGLPCCPAFPVNGCANICRGGEEGQSCDFNAQCRPPLVCNVAGECRDP